MKIIWIFLFALLFNCMQVFAAANPIVAEYFGIWTERGQTWEQKFRADTPFDKLNRLYIAFGKIIKTEDHHFSVDFDGRAERVSAVIAKTKAMNPGAEIFFVLGGNGSGHSFGGAAHDPQFAKNVMHFLRQYGFIGLDIDWEMGLDKTNLNKLVTTLSAMLHQNGFKLTLDVWPYPVPAYDMNVLKENLDQINMMSYGTGLSVSQCAQRYERLGFPTNKMIGAIETESGYHQFGGVTDTLGVTGTIHEKAKYVLDHGLAGMMEWRLDNDYVLRDKPNYPTYQGANELWEEMMIISHF